MKYAFQHPRNGHKSIHLIFTQEEAKVLMVLVGDVVPDKVDLDDAEISVADLKQFLQALFVALNTCT